MKTLQLAIMAIAGIMAIGIASFAVIYNTTQETAASQKYQYVIHESYDGIDKNFGTVTIQNKPYHVTNLNENIQGSTNPTWIEMYGVNFSFPNGIKLVNTPGGSFFESYVTFPDESVPYKMAGSLSSLPGSPRYDFTTVLSTHTDPQAGFTIHKDKIQLLINWPKVYSELSINDLDDTYKAGQPIYFTVEAKGFDYFNAGATPDVQIERPDGTSLD